MSIVVRSSLVAFAAVTFAALAPALVRAGEPVSNQPAVAVPGGAPAADAGGCPKSPGGACCASCQEKAAKVEDGSAKGDPAVTHAEGGGCPCQRAREAAKKGS